jgi:hypothetical protein
VVTRLSYTMSRNEHGYVAKCDVLFASSTGTSRVKALVALQKLVGLQISDWYVLEERAQEAVVAATCPPTKVTEPCSPSLSTSPAPRAQVARAGTSCR